MAVKQTAGRDALGEFAAKFAELNDDVLFGQVWSREDKRDVKMKLDSCVSEFATEAFDSIKQGDNYEFMLDLEKLKENAYRHLGFGSDDASITYENGNCMMSRPTVTTLSGNGFGLTVAYTVSFSIVWGGRTYADLEVPITVTSYYKFK